MVNSQYDDDFISPNSDEFVDASDSSSGEFTEENHSFDVVVFEEFDIGTHFSDLANLHDDELVDCGKLIFVEPTVA